MADSSGVCTHLYGFFGVDDPVSVDVQGSKTLTNLGNLQVDRCPRHSGGGKSRKCRPAGVVHVWFRCKALSGATARSGILSFAASALPGSSNQGRTPSKFFTPGGSPPPFPPSPSCPRCPLPSDEPGAEGRLERRVPRGLLRGFR